MRIVILAGGVGGARMARGFAALESVDTTVIVNVGDDDAIYGVDLSPDIDTVVYMLAGIEGEFGWGRQDDTWEVMDELERFDLDTSFRLGDRDLALNLFRTTRLRAGHPLSAVTSAQCTAFGIHAKVLPVTDDRVRTRLQVGTGAWLDFQTYFVRRRHQDHVTAVAYDGASTASPAPGVLEEIEEADAVVVAPSNPFLSILPILSIPGVRETVEKKQVIAVSPFVGGQTVKGPAADIMASLGHDPSPTGLGGLYAGLLDHLVVDPGDTAVVPGVHVHPADIMIGQREQASRLAKEMIEWLT
jgi:LPPG:FO 2-phospho-L-lactate transferase